MTPTFDRPDEARVPDPEDWQVPTRGGLSAEALTNEADDLAASLPESIVLPSGADEADVLEQLRDAGAAEEDELRGD